MKSLFKLFILVVLSFSGFWSCQNDAELIDSSNQMKIINENDIAIIKALGLDVTSIVDMGDYYLVEGDIALLKSQINDYLPNYGQGPVTRQSYMPGALVSHLIAKNMTVRIDNSISTTGHGGLWRDAVENAIAAWNSIPNCLINFTLITSSNADITVKLGHDDNPDVIAWAPLPSNSRPGSSVTINDLQLSYENKTFAITHELGHTIGLLHTHVLPPTSSILISGTPTIDNASIMSYVSDRSLYPGFSFHDVIALQTLYPFSNEHITSTTINVCSDEIVTFTISDYTGLANWEAIENAILVSGQGTNRATFRASGNGYMKVGASYNYSGYQFSIESASKVWVGIPSIPNIFTMPQFFANSHYDATASTSSPGSTFTWMITGATYTINPEPNNGSSIYLKAGNYYSDATATIKVIATNKCGSLETTKIVPIKGHGGYDPPEI